jgi:hypothetical protein
MNSKTRADGSDVELQERQRPATAYPRYETRAVSDDRKSTQATTQYDDKSPLMTRPAACRAIRSGEQVGEYAQQSSRRPRELHIFMTVPHFMTWCRTPGAASRGRPPA